MILSDIPIQTENLMTATLMKLYQYHLNRRITYYRTGTIILEV